jgi:hypothetical protein
VTGGRPSRREATRQRATPDIGAAAEPVTHPALAGGSIRFADETAHYTVRAVSADHCYAICPKPCNLRRTLLDTSVEFERRHRGPDNCYGLG